MKKILVIEDDHGIANSLKLYLENSNFLVELEDNGNHAIKSIKKHTPDLIILDLNLPGKDGIEITKEYRKIGNTPIIMLTARSGEFDRVQGLEIGADDYIAKPFSPRELLARINTILRRFAASTEVEHTNDKHIFQLENLKIDSKKKLVFVNNETVSLTANEYEILITLFEKNGEILTREEIMK